MAQEDSDTELARLLHAAGLVELGQLQALLGRARAGGGSLREQLLHRGLINPADLAGLAAPQPAPAPGGFELPQARKQPKSLGEYRILEQLGAGGMGAVHLAEHMVTGARYALKTMLSRSLGSRRQRFQREGQAQAMSDAHPNVVRVHAAGEEDGQLYLVMDLCEGGDLDDRLAEGTLEPQVAARIVGDLARGLEHVHQQGILHRDIKPANVLFDVNGTPKLVDFGLAKVADAETLTKTGAVVGTLAYMSPEQARGVTRELTATTDVWALGVVLYRSMTGRLPFDGATGIALIRQIVQDDPPSPRSLNKNISRGLERVILRCLAKHPEDRFASAAELADALGAPERVSGPRRRVKRGRLLIGAAVAVCALAGAGVGGGALASRDEPETLTAVEADAEARTLRDLAWTQLSAARPLAPDAGLPDAWEARRDALLESLEEVADPPAPLRVAERHVAALRGLLAVDAGDLPSALRWKSQLERTSSEKDPVLRAVAGAVAAVTTSGDPLTAALWLDEARAAGIARPELAAWRDQAKLRRSLHLMSGGELREAIDELSALEDLQAVDGALRRAVIGKARREVDLATGVLEREKKYEDAFETRLELLLRYLIALQPEQPLEPDALERLVAVATQRPQLTRRVKLAIADVQPDDLRLQNRIVQTFYHSSPTPEFYRTAAREFKRVAVRARSLAREPADVLETGVELCEILHHGRLYVEAGDAADDLLERDLEMDDPTRGKLLFWLAGRELRQKKKPRAMRLVNECIALYPTFHLAYQRKAGLHSSKREWQETLDASHHLITEVDLKMAPQYAHFYGQACMYVWKNAWRVKDYTRMAEGAQKMLKAFPDPARAGWWIRLAFAQSLGGDTAAAQKSLERAVEQLPRTSTLRDLAGRARKVRDALRSGAADAPKQLEALNRDLEKRRRSGNTIP